jgi:hypothetical protein
MPDALSPSCTGDSSIVLQSIKKQEFDLKQHTHIQGLLGSVVIYEAIFLLNLPATKNVVVTVLKTFKNWKRFQLIFLKKNSFIAPLLEQLQWSGWKQCMT